MRTETYPGVTMRISLHQPYAALIVAGLKRTETRSWKPAAHRIGQRLGIHAARRWDRDQALHWRDLREELGLTGMVDLGAVVAVCTLAEAIRTEDLPDHPLYDELMESEPFGDYHDGRYVWRLTDVVPVVPENVRGYQGFFPVHRTLHPKGEA